MSKVVTKWITDDAVTQDKIRLDNNAALKARNAGDSANIEILKVNASDRIEFISLPQMTADPSSANDLARKSYVDTKADTAAANTVTNNAFAGAWSTQIWVAPSQQAVYNEMVTKFNIAGGSFNSGSNVTMVGGGQVLGLPATPTVGDAATSKTYVDAQIAAMPAVPPVFEIKGNWDATLNSPALATSVGTEKDLYYVNVAGTTSLDSEDVWSKGDWVYFLNGVWNRADNVDAVSSVNGLAGVVVLDTDDITEGATNLYYTQARFDAAFTAKDSDSLPEGVTNLYFTNARAKSAAVADSITNAVTDVAPSQNAVFDALALKADDADVIKKDGSVAYTGPQAMGSNKITGLANGAAASQDAATVAQVEAAIAVSESSAVSYQHGRQVKTISATHISNGYMDLAQLVLPNSETVTPKGGLLQEIDVDYTLFDLLSGTRLSFAGDLLSTLVIGDKLIIKYEYL
jgi:hypothetical protein